MDEIEAPTDFGSDIDHSGTVSDRSLLVQSRCSHVTFRSSSVTFYVLTSEYLQNLFFEK